MCPLVDSRDELCNSKRNEMKRKEKTSVLLYKTLFFFFLRLYYRKLLKGENNTRSHQWLLFYDNVIKKRQISLWLARIVWGNLYCFYCYEF